MLDRVLEPEAMDSPEEAADYDAMNHGDVNRRFAAEFLAIGPIGGEILDLGTGTAQIPIELCRQWPAARILAVDLSESMLRLAARNIEAAGLAGQIRLERIDAKRLPYPDGAFAAVMSNSIVHHVPDPTGLFAEAWRVTAPGGRIFFRDLFRPADEATLRQLVQTYAGNENAHSQQMLADSFRAALTVDEMRALVAPLGCDPASVQATSDRHWTWSASKGGN
jgi:ubiquinone/menaquinone biosynthesis C-methylase UbiE